MTVANKMIAVGRFDRIPPEESKDPSVVGGGGRLPGAGRPPGPRHRAAAARAPRAGRPRARHRPVRRRGAPREPPDAADLPGGRLQGRGRLHRRRDAGGLPDRRHRHVGQRDAGPGAPGRVRLDPAVLQRPQRRGHRGVAAPRHDRADAGAQPGARRLPGPGVRREPGGPVGGRPAGVRRGQRHPRHRRRGDRRGPGRGGAGRRARLRREGRARARRDLLGVRRDGGGGPAAAAPAGRPGPQLRPAPGGAQRARHHQHRGRLLPERLALDADAAPRPGRLLLPVRGARRRDPREGRPPRPRALDLRQRRQPRGRLGQRPAAVLGGGRRDRGRAALPRVDRQPPQVQPARAARLPAQAGDRGEVRPLHPGRADGPRGPLDAGAAGRRRRDVPAGRA